MRVCTTRAIVRRRPQQRPESLLVAASGCQTPASAVELLAGLLIQESQIVEASCQTTPDGFALLMRLAVTGGPGAMGHVRATLRETAQRHGIVLTLCPAGNRGGLL